MLTWLLVFFRFKPRYEYGTLLSKGGRARRDRLNGRIEFVLWAKGESQAGYIYTEDYWHEAGPGHHFCKEAT